MKKLLIIVSLSATQLSAQDLTGLANAFLNSLDAKQKAAGQFSLDDAERYNWHFIPRERKGACFRTFNPGQRTAGLALLKASLSEQGFKKANDIMALENVLREIEGLGSTSTHRDPINYYITIFGTPESGKAWGWRFEGHHISINFSSTNKELVSATPTFWGSNPATVPSGAEKGKQILRMETDLGFELVNMLTNEQKAKAILSDKAPADIISFNQPKTKALEPVGLLYTEMTKPQQEQLMKLLNVYVGNYQLGFANKLMAKITTAGINKLSFAWAGGLSSGTGNYYRIQGPVLLIEYDNTQTNANHVHTSVRDLTNDFAEDLLREHYKLEH